MFISTQHNMVYGFDADSFGSAPLWSRSLGSATNAADISTVRYCSDIPYEEARPVLQYVGCWEQGPMLAPPAYWHGALLCAVSACTRPVMHFTDVLSHAAAHVLYAPAWCAALACMLGQMRIRMPACAHSPLHTRAS